jgi:hypothetical protein
VRLRELLSNLGAPLDNALEAISDTSKYIKSDTLVLGAEVRTTLLRSNHWLEPAEVDSLLDVYLAGADLSALGRQFNVHRTTARRHLLDRGIPMRSAKSAMTDQVALWIVNYESGVSTSKLAEEFGT